MQRIELNDKQEQAIIKTITAEMDKIKELGFNALAKERRDFIEEEIRHGF